ncbi:hypothetical protein [Sessilibacter corallicola]|uniref:hypothetical protein n=1 Tax=Sessilibacter corallicola TaxID=2904075 RepID=UPI001E63492C|nr:hypothetical protein [Sessilibacter corallicola]MCE2026753.1 hypothetical protein [Sessilibacter corallicola]
MSPIPDEVSDYLKANTQEFFNQDGLYSLEIYFHGWSYSPITDVDSLEKKLHREYKPYLLIHDIDLDQNSMLIKFLLRDEKLSSELGHRAVGYDYLGDLNDAEVDFIKSEFVSQHTKGFIKHLFVQIVRWGGLVLVLFAFVYSIDRFYRRFFVDSTVDRFALLIQSGLIGICILAIFISIDNVWPGSLLLPIIVIVMFAELYSIVRKKLTTRKLNNSSR